MEMLRNLLMGCKLEVCLKGLAEKNKDWSLVSFLECYHIYGVLSIRWEKKVLSQNMEQVHDL